jgi:multidrug efflux pump subunit AcrA (membrane-fusion protein)
VRLRPVKIGRNYGQSVEVLDGLTAADEVVLNPSDSLTEGDQVVVAPKQNKVANSKAPDQASAK